MRHLYVAAELIESAGIAEAGVDLFVQTMPHDVKCGIMLRDPLYGADLDQGMDKFVQHQFQVIIRDVDVDVAYERALNISDALTVQDLVRSDIEIRKMYPLQLPASFPTMDSDEMETSVRIRVWFSHL